MAFHKATTFLQPHMTTYIFKDILVSIYFLMNYKHFSMAHRHHLDKFLVHDILIRIQLHPSQVVSTMCHHTHASMAMTWLTTSLSSVYRIPRKPLKATPFTFDHPYPHYLHNKHFWKGPICNLDTQIPLSYKQHLIQEVTPRHPPLHKMGQ